MRPISSPGKAFAEHVLAHQVLVRGVHVGLGLHFVTEIAKDLHRALVGDVRPRRVREPPVAVDDHVLDAIRRQERRRHGARGPGSDDQNIGFNLCHGLFLL
jgi:hypothetical protein